MKARKIVKRRLPIQLCKLHLSVEIFVSGQSFPFHFGAGLEHVRERVLFPPPQVTLHGCHDDHWLQLPFTEIKSTISDMKALNRVWTADVLNWKNLIGLHSATVFENGISLQKDLVQDKNSYNNKIQYRLEKKGPQRGSCIIPDSKCFRPNCNWY